MFDLMPPLFVCHNIYDSYDQVLVQIFYESIVTWSVHLYLPNQDLYQQFQVIHVKVLISVLVQYHDELEVRVKFLLINFLF